MEGMRSVTGKEILQAIAHAKKMNPKDIYGEGAFQIDIGNIKKTDMVRYVPVNINVFCGKDEAGEDKWEFVPFNVSFRKVTTRSKIPTLDERRNGKIKSVTLQFRNTSKSYWNVNGKEVEDPIGEALVTAETIIRRKLARLIKGKKLHNNNLNLNMFVQYDQKDKDTGDVIKTFDEQLIRMEIKFRKPTPDATNVEASQTPWMCDIYDATKPRPSNQTPPGEPNYYPATMGFGEGDDQPINYGNIHMFIRGGSSITGFLNCSQISLSGQGISLTPRFSALIVKKSSGFKPNFATSMAGQLDDLGDAHVEALEEDPSGMGGGMDSGGSSGMGAGPAPSGMNADDFGDDADEFGEDPGDTAGDVGDNLPEDDDLDDFE
jgi:hypothetical protein